METNIEEVAFLDVSIDETGRCVIELSDNGKLANCLAESMIQDDSILTLMLETYISYQLKLNTDNLKPKKQFN